MEGSSTAEDTKPKLERITISVRENDNSVDFKVTKKIRFQKIIDAYSEKTGKSPNSLKFLFNGQRLQGDASLADLGLEDGDIVDVHLEQVGGYAEM